MQLCLKHIGNNSPINKQNLEQKKSRNQTLLVQKEIMLLPQTKSLKKTGMLDHRNHTQQHSQIHCQPY